MEDTISRAAVQEMVDRIGGMYPYRQIGNRDSYSPYNEGWTDAICRVDAELNSLPSAQPETAHKVKGKVKAGVTLWYSCDHCERPVDKYDAYCHCCGRRFVDE